jgi:alpha-beta hydrolase superfamily lysophospholipase
MRREYTITSNQDNLKLSVLEYVPEHPKAIIQIAHGMTEHKERYEELMESLSKEGFICCINDHRGHGKSIIEEKDHGYFYDSTGTYIVEDLHQITNHLKDEYPNLPVYLIGHSMGSLVVRKYIKKYDKDIDKLIICGSPSQINFIDGGIFFAKLIKLFKGDRYRSKFLQKITFNGFDKRFKEKTPNSWINSDPAEVKKYNRDKKCGYIFTVNGFLNLYYLLKESYSRRGWELNNPDLPILFIAGKNDPAIINESAWLNSMTFLREIGYSDIKHILYENDRHEILKEKDQEKVFADIYKFISRKN